MYGKVVVHPVQDEGIVCERNLVFICLFFDGLFLWFFFGLFTWLGSAWFGSVWFDLVGPSEHGFVYIVKLLGALEMPLVCPCPFDGTRRFRAILALINHVPSIFFAECQAVADGKADALEKVDNLNSARAFAA